MPARVTTIGVIADTHGLVRPEALAALVGVGDIIHAGDVGGHGVYDALTAIAPVTVVRGNNDRDAWGRQLPLTAQVERAGRRIFVLHDRADLDLDPVAAGLDVVIFGHSHRPAESRERGVLFLNPGSAGPRRFRLPISLARLELGAGAPAVEFVTLDAEARRP